MTRAARGNEAREAAERKRVADLMFWESAVFVFGSNEAGKHGRGAAKEAYQQYGAEWGVGSGQCGRSYAIPTKSAGLVTLGIPVIRQYVKEFLHIASLNPECVYAVTRVGCGLAGYTDSDISPMFTNAPKNCELPEGWRTLPPADGDTGDRNE